MLIWTLVSAFTFVILPLSIIEFVPGFETMLRVSIFLQKFFPSHLWDPWFDCKESRIALIAIAISLVFQWCYTATLIHDSKSELTRFLIKDAWMLTTVKRFSLNLAVIFFYIWFNFLLIFFLK